MKFREHLTSMLKALSAWKKLYVLHVYTATYKLMTFNLFNFSNLVTALKTTLIYVCVFLFLSCWLGKLVSLTVSENTSAWEPHSIISTLLCPSLEPQSGWHVKTPSNVGLCSFCPAFSQYLWRWQVSCLSSFTQTWLSRKYSRYSQVLLKFKEN